MTESLLMAMLVLYVMDAYVSYRLWMKLDRLQAKLTELKDELLRVEKTL